MDGGAAADCAIFVFCVTILLLYNVCYFTTWFQSLKFKWNGRTYLSLWSVGKVRTYRGENVFRAAPTCLLASGVSVTILTSLRSNMARFQEARTVWAAAMMEDPKEGITAAQTIRNMVGRTCSLPPSGHDAHVPVSHNARIALLCWRSPRVRAPSIP